MAKPILKQGDTEPIRVVVHDEATSALYDLAGCQIEWKLAAGKDATEALLTKTLAASQIEVTGTGVFEVKLEHAETAALAPGEYFHQARLTLPGGGIKTIFGEWLTVEDTLP